MDHRMNAVGMVVAVRAASTATARPLFGIEESLGEWIVLDFQRRYLVCY